MKKSKFVTLPICAALISSSWTPIIADEAALDGAQLFTAKACMSCHGADGRSPIMPLYPKIAGQNIGYLYNQMRDIKSGSRNSGQSVVMKGIMATVNDQEMRAIAAWLSTQ